ncbi:polymer-forming cytoskeletal protein [Bdellovibrionota bacterium FG-1]
MTQQLHEASLNIVSEGTRIEGKVTFDQITRFHGRITGEAHGRDGSTLILCEAAVVEGNVFADVLWVDGFVQGNIYAKTRVVVSGSGRVIGNIETPTLKLEPGAYFEGKCRMDQKSQ